VNKARKLAEFWQDSCRESLPDFTHFASPFAAAHLIHGLDVGESRLVLRLRLIEDSRTKYG
jgi:hypothetical protein